jgi:hypothetical protein
LSHDSEGINSLVVLEEKEVSKKIQKIKDIIFYTHNRECVSYINHSKFIKSSEKKDFQELGQVISYQTGQIHIKGFQL